VNLYQRLKKDLPEHTAAISDAESIILNRRDFHIAQISPVHAFLNVVGARVGYPYRVMLSLIDQVGVGIVKEDFNIVLGDPSLSLASLYAWVRSGGSSSKGQIYAPKGAAPIPTADSFFGELASEYTAATHDTADARPSEERKGLFTFVLGNTKKSEQSIFAADRYSEATTGFLLLKDYARVDAKEEREYLESKGIFPSITYEGHGFCFK
jgi:hypothetical protein